MKTHTITTYLFNELSNEAKAKAIEKNRFNLVESDWWDDTIQDAKSVFGINIKSFSIDRDRHIDIEFINDLELTAYKIIDEYGEETELYKDAHLYIKSREKTIQEAQKDENGEFLDIELLDEQLDELDNSFKEHVEHTYLNSLETEYEWLISDECIEDFLEANQCEFLENGNSY